MASSASVAFNVIGFLFRAKHETHGLFDSDRNRGTKRELSPLVNFWDASPALMGVY